MQSNFKNPTTGKEFHIGEYKTKFIGGKIVFTDKYNRPLVDPDTGELLEKIERGGKIGAPTILGSEQEQYAKTQNHFRKRAKKHAQSEEGQALKKKAITREMGNMGYKPRD